MKQVTPEMCLLFSHGIAVLPQNQGKLHARGINIQAT